MRDNRLEDELNGTESDHQELMNGNNSRNDDESKLQKFSDQSLFRSLIHLLFFLQEQNSSHQD